VEDELAAKGGDQWTTADIDKLIEAGMEFEFLNSSCTFPMYTSTDKETRDVSAKAENLLDEYSIQSGMREDMFKAFSAFSDRVKKGEVCEHGSSLIYRDACFE
jgi:Zn-dependent oligopeptidase